MGLHHVGQAGLQLLTSGDPSASASQSGGITGVSHDAQLPCHLSNSVTWYSLSLFIYLSIYLMESHSVTQAGVQWYDLASL